MADAQRTDQQHTPQSCIPTWDTDDPLQQQVSALLKRLPRDICGVIALGDDGVLRSLTADRKVLAAEGLSKSYNLPTLPLYLVVRLKLLTQCPTQPNSSGAHSSLPKPLPARLPKQSHGAGYR